VALPSPGILTVSPLAPLRCHLEFDALTIAPSGTADPTPGNNRAVLELNIVDNNDLLLSDVHDVVVKSLQPLKLTLPRGRSTVSRQLLATVVNVDPDELGADTITLSVDQGDCPPGTVGMPDFDPRTFGAQTSGVVRSGARAFARIPVSITSAAFSSPNGKAPARCTAQITAAGSGTDGSIGNNVTQLTIDVTDKNDF
jgi:hypothetical protein